MLSENYCIILLEKRENMKTVTTAVKSQIDFNYGNVFAVERKNDFLVIMKLVIGSSLFFAIALLIF